MICCDEQKEIRLAERMNFICPTAPHGSGLRIRKQYNSVCNHPTGFVIPFAFAQQSGQFRSDHSFNWAHIALCTQLTMSRSIRTTVTLARQFTSTATSSFASSSTSHADGERKSTVRGVDPDKLAGGDIDPFTKVNEHNDIPWMGYLKMFSSTENLAMAEKIHAHEDALKGGLLISVHTDSQRTALNSCRRRSPSG